MQDTVFRSDLVPRDPRDALALDYIGGIEGDVLLSVLNASQDCIKLVQPDGRLSFMNVNGICALQIDDFDLVADRPWPDLWPESSRPVLQDALRRAAKGERLSFEAECPTAKGTLKWWNVSVLPVLAADGTVLRILATSRDITERMLRERDQRAYAADLERELAEKSDLLAQRDFLMREIDHRVKNSLAQVASILRLQARRSDPMVRAALDEAARRVGSIARVHEQLQISDTFKLVPVIPLLDRLCNDHAQSFDRHIAFHPGDVAEIQMPSDRASALSIILSELVANGIRHGTGTGAIDVSLDQTDGQAALCVVNHADAPRTDRQSPDSGLGTMICQTYAAALDGAIDWSFADAR
jgi:two-component sensor histidine kinase